MPTAARSALILAGLVVVLLLAGLWGWSQVSAPFPQKAEPPKCVDRVVAAGDKVFADQVTVSVFNASTRNGLAGRTMLDLTDAGFGAGDSGNAPRNAEVDSAAIWTETPKGPDVRLVASWLGRGVPIERRDGLGVGVTVVVGDDFESLVKGPRSVRARDDATICTPPVE